jgi:hypothetical protein
MKAPFYLYNYNKKKLLTNLNFYIKNYSSILLSIPEINNSLNVIDNMTKPKVEESFPSLS